MSVFFSPTIFCNIFSLLIRIGCNPYDTTLFLFCDSAVELKSCGKRLQSKFPLSYRQFGSMMPLLRFQVVTHTLKWVKRATNIFTFQLFQLKVHLHFQKPRKLKPNRILHPENPFS